VTVSFQTAAGQLIGHWRTTAEGYDGEAAQLVDLSGNGNHLPKLAGAPTFGTYGGHLGLQLRGDNYFGGKPMVQFWPSAFTLVMPVFVNGVGGTFAFLQGDLRDNTDPDWENFAAGFGLGAVAQQSFRAQVGLFGNAVIGNLGGGGVGFNYTDNAWNVMQFVCDPDASVCKARIGNAAWTVAQVPNGQYMLPYLFNDFRLGYRSANVPAGSFAMGQMMLYFGNAPADHAKDYTALISALVADPNA
jgi:hypothetical protein